MRVLWFSVTPALYNTQRNAHNGGGWIEALEEIVNNHHDFSLGIAFIDNNATSFSEKINDVVYYPLKVKRSKIYHFHDLYTSKNNDDLILEKCQEVIADFKPNIIQVFGSEWCFGLLKNVTDIPIVIHMQGCWPPYRNCQYPPGYSKFLKYLYLMSNPKKLLNNFLMEHASKERAIREEKILRENLYYMGRTRWDKSLTKLYNPHRKYYYCSEALRSSFVNCHERWTINDNKLCLLSVGGGHVLKGYDLVLKTALLLKENYTDDFQWFLCGPTHNDMALFERLTGIKCNDVNVIPLGKCSSEAVKCQLLRSTLYIHTAYIDNSPNSVCEAQYMGVPVISTNVGGIPSLFSKDYPLDMLVPVNDPYYLASKIIEATNDKDTLKKMSEENYQLAHSRHDSENIYNSLLTCYKSILNQKTL